jgi:hypothetical protein
VHEEHVQAVAVVGISDTAGCGERKAVALADNEVFKTAEKDGAVAALRLVGATNRR